MYYIAFPAVCCLESGSLGAEIFGRFRNLWEDSKDFDVWKCWKILDVLENLYNKRRKGFNPKSIYASHPGRSDALNQKGGAFETQRSTKLLNICRRRYCTAAAATILPPPLLYCRRCYAPFRWWWLLLRVASLFLAQEVPSLLPLSKVAFLHLVVQR